MTEPAAFLRAVAEGKIDDVRAALAVAPALVNATGPHPYWGGRPQPLHVSIELQQREIFDLLLEAGADVDGDNEDYDLWSPLMLTLSRNRPDMRETLLARGARIGLVEALLMKDDAKVGELLAGGLPAAAPNGGSFLAFARTPRAVDALIEAGASTEARDRWGATPIDTLSRLGPEGRALIDQLMFHAVVAEPRHLARLGDQKGLAVLAEFRTDILGAEAVIMAAVEFRHHDLVRWLLERGARANARAEDGARQSALHSAAWNGDREMVELLVAAGAGLRARDSQHNGTPEDWARASVRLTGNAGCAEVADWLAARPAS
jgi:ankyrin repeat protein